MLRAVLQLSLWQKLSLPMTMMYLCGESLFYNIILAVVLILLMGHDYDFIYINQIHELFHSCQ